MMIVKIADLHYCSGSSDKVYHAALVERPDGCTVQFAYGRRGSSLTYGEKTTSPVSRDKAEKVFDKLVSEKSGKGYKPSAGISGRVFDIPMDGDASSGGEAVAVAAVADKQASGYQVQLLNELPEKEVDRYINDPRYGFQEKMNGNRLVVVCNGTDAKGINRKGFYIPASPAILTDARSLDVAVTLDGEGIGEVHYVFDCLELQGRDLRTESFINRYSHLHALLKEANVDALKIVPLALTVEDKRALYERVKAEGGEGIVIKDLFAPYTAGRPASGGDQLKIKFWATCSAIVALVNTQRSVLVSMYDEAGSLVNMGNVTIPVNYEVPSVGSVVEVRYLYAYPNGSLYQPQYEGERSDIDALECRTSQLKYLDKAA